MPNIMLMPDDTSVYQYLTYVKLQLKNGFPVSTDYASLHSEYLSYCKRNKIIYLSKDAFGRSLNSLGIESEQKFNSDLGKTVTYKVITIEKIEDALRNLGGDLIVENIYTVLNNKRYQMQIKIIPLDTPDLEELEKESKEVNLLKKVDPDHSGETE